LQDGSEPGKLDTVLGIHCKKGGEMRAKRLNAVWIGMLLVVGVWALTSPTAHDPCPFLISCSLLLPSWEFSPDPIATSLPGELSLPPPRVLSTFPEKPPR